MELFIRPNDKQFKQAGKVIALMDQTMTTAPKSTIMISKLAKRIKKISAPITRFFEDPSQIFAQYGDSEYDLISVFKLLKYEPIFLKSVQKKLALLVKSGYSVYSEDEEIKDYMNARFDYMFMQTGKSIKHLVKRAAFYLISCSNAFIIKVRDKNFEFASSYYKGDKELHPVVGLFIAHPTSMKPKFKSVKVGKHGYRLEIDKWIHTNRAGFHREFDVDDVAHFSLNKEDGMIFGMPEVIPVIDDIRTLRKFEEDVQLLFYRDLFPIIHYQVDKPTEIDHRTNWTELDQAREDMQSIIQDGGIATDKRHDIKFIGSDGKGLDPKPYLEYFRDRVYTGLGVSSADMGQGQDISGNTASSMSKQLTDAVRWVQQELSNQFNELILVEMILQSPFGVEAFKEKALPILKFVETDIEWKIRKENHEADLFQKGLKDIDEARASLGLTPMKEEQIAKTQQGLYGQLGIDQETDSAEHLARINAAVAPKTTAPTGSKPKNPSKKSAADRDSIKSAKTNSNTVKSNRDSILKDTMSSLDLQDQFKALLSDNKLNTIIATKYVYEAIKQNMAIRFKDGVSDTVNLIKPDSPRNIEIKDNIFESIDSLCQSVTRLLQDDINKINRVAARIATSNRTEEIRAYNYGVLLTAKEYGIEKLEFIHDNLSDITEESAKLIGKTIEVKNLTVEDLPPFRPNQRVKVRIVN